MLIDLHVHSWLSRDCQLDPKAVLARAETHGLDGVAFTETNTQDGCDELFDLQRTTKLKIFVGLELATDKGQYLCFFPDPLKAPEPVQMWGSNREKPWSAEECLTKIHSLGAAIVAARPFDRDAGNPAGDYVKTLKCLSAVEVYNPKVRPGANEQAIEAAQALKLPGIAGSDARTSLDELGYGATLFKSPITTQAGLVKALQGGAFWPVQMGELPHLRRPGEAKTAEAKHKKQQKKRRWRN
ncbi:MAG: PHP domain-containing protein [Myxococcaceae bacterium]|nr:PHP domain-containing protein [Myxococcaceae bacterium]